MWIRNTDTGKWSNQRDTLPREYYENLKVDLEKVKLYSKCLSGATYLTINDTDNLYPQMNIEKLGFFHGNLPPFNGPKIQITADNVDEYYDKYLKEDGFTIKNLFTPDKLLEDQGKNFKSVDVATTESILLNPSRTVTIDGVSLISGHRILVKDEVTQITLASSIDPETYFTDTITVSSFTISNSTATSTTYKYYNSTNGIYRYDGLNFIRENELDSYNDAYKLVLTVKSGQTNTDKQFHLQRLKTGYFPTEGFNIEFKEQKNWVLRNRVDYNNIYDLSYYDIKIFPPEEVYDIVDNKTYSIPERIIAIGEFGVILNNQDKLTTSATYSISNIISNKYKVNLRSLDSTKSYYWVCGDEGTLLRIHKKDFKIEQIDLGEDLNLTSVSFYNELYGMVVGKFNKIYFTRDGGWNWSQLAYAEFERFSYNKVLHYGTNEVYIGGETGIFLQLIYTGNTWIFYKKDPVKKLEELDQYSMVGDINDLFSTKFVNIKSLTSSTTITNNDIGLEDTFIYTTKLNKNNQLEVSIDSYLFETLPIINDNISFYICFSFSFPDGTQYINPEFGTTVDTYNYSIVDLSNTTDVLTKTFSLPTTTDGNIISGEYFFNFDVKHNYDFNNPFQPTDTYTQSFFSLNRSTDQGDLILMACNNENMVAFDRNKILNNIKDNNFSFISFTQSFTDCLSISRRPGTGQIYIAGDKLYSFNISNFNNFTQSISNSAIGDLAIVDNYFANKILLNDNNFFIVGNSSLVKVDTFSGQFSDIDPSFNQRTKSRFLVLDYDIGAKLNFFDDNRNYRLPTAVTINESYVEPEYIVNSFNLKVKTGSPFPPGQPFFPFNFLSSVGEFGIFGISSTLYLSANEVTHIAFREENRFETSITDWLSEIVGQEITFRRSDTPVYYAKYMVTGLQNTQDLMRTYTVQFKETNTNWATLGNTLLPQNSLSNPNPVYLNISTGNRDAFIEVESLPSEKSWIDYYLDSEKTFIYSSSMEDSTAIKFSTRFTYDPFLPTFTASNIGTKLSDMGDGSGGYLAPNFTDITKSEFIGSQTLIFPSSFKTDNDLLLYKNLAIIKISHFTGGSFGNNEDYNAYSDKTQVNDVLSLTSDVVDAQLVVNRIRYYVGSNDDAIGIFTQSKPLTVSPSWTRLDTYLYCYSNFNESIINNLKKSTSPILIQNLNRYNSSSEFIEKFNSHPLGYGYKMIKNNDLVTIQPLFNEKTAYYNLQARFKISSDVRDLVYKENFLDFGFTPTYNISTFLNKINPEIFTYSKEFLGLPVFINLTGNNFGPATDDVIYVDSSVPSNVLRFGKNYYFQWKSLSVDVFVDIVAKTSFGEFAFEQCLVLEKYYDPTSDAYFIKFNKKIDIPVGSGYGLRLIDIKSRNTLLQISNDLQLLNNIHRTTIQKEIQPNKFFTNYENSIKTKFTTESYLKAFVTDYDIRKNITAILYNDSDFQLSMNVLNVEKELNYTISQVVPDNNNKMTFQISGVRDEIKVGDLVNVEFEDNFNQSMEGMQTVIFAYANTIITSKDYNSLGLLGTGTLKVVKKDSFFNYQPVDIFRASSSRQANRSVEILPKNVELSGKIFRLKDLDYTKYKIQLVDGLSFSELSKSYHWILEAEVSNALIGRDQNGIVWYSGTWRCGRWFGGTWNSGKWITGDWYRGVWNAYNVSNNFISAKVDTSYSDQAQSKWYNGRWFEGIWSNGIWYNGRWYGGVWNSGTWFNGIWNDGTWKKGTFRGGIWVQGNWKEGSFNCDAKPAFWIDGKFLSGDFENGMWYNGIFGNDIGLLSRFGTRASNTRTATWQAGKWINGQFHSSLNQDRNTGLVKVSEIHKYSIWKTGFWNKGDWYGGIAYNIHFKGGTWHGGILDEIQVIGIDAISPGTYSTNKIYLNGIFRFNVGDEIHIIDDDRNTPFSPLGSNSLPRKYRINKSVIDLTNKQTGLHLNYNLSSLGVQPPFDTRTYSIGAEYDNRDLGLRVVSYFKDVTWKSGLWRNGIFEGREFESGIWYNGIFDGIWGK
jgi:hypothetical protein